MTLFYLLFYIFILLFSFAAYKKGALNISGAAAAVIVGFLTFAGFGVKGFVLLGVFFVSSMFWSKWKKGNKEDVLKTVEKGSERDWAQVLANGGIPAIFSLVNYIMPNSIWLIGFTVSLAAANADTWASEIGVLSKKEPYHIKTFKKVKRETSGAVSVLGTFAGFAGSVLIGIVAYVFWSEKLIPINIFVIIMFGFFSMLIDTVLGSSVQQVNRCIVCHADTEKHVHCGQPTYKVKGILHFNNDIVNTTSIFLSSTLSIIYFMLLCNG